MEALHRLVYTGYKFEAACTSKSSLASRSLTTLSCRRHQTLLALIIDCINSGLTDPADAFSKYTELKAVHRSESMSSKLSMYGHMYTKFWLQIFLAGVLTVTVGTRSNNRLPTSTQDFHKNNIFSNVQSFLDSRFMESISLMLRFWMDWM